MRPVPARQVPRMAARHPHVVDGAASGRPRLNRSRAVIVLGALAIVAIVGGVLVVRWPHGARSLAEAGAETGGSVTVGRTMYTMPVVDPVGRPPVQLNIQSIRPVIELNSARANIRVLS